MNDITEKKAILLGDDEHAYNSSSKKPAHSLLKLLYYLWKYVLNLGYLACTIFSVYYALSTASYWLLACCIVMTAMFLYQFAKEEYIVNNEPNIYGSRNSEYFLSWVLASLCYPLSFLYMIEDIEEADFYYQQFYYKSGVFAILRETGSSLKRKPVQINPGFLMKIYMVLWRHPVPGSEEAEKMNLLINEIKGSKY